VYRSKNSTGIRDEQVRFADFCVSESSSSQCPSSIGSGTPTFSGFYRLTPRHSGKALVVQSASTADGAAVIQYTYGGSNTNDEWELRSIGSGYYRIINRNSLKDMVVQSASTSDGAAIIQYTYGGSNTNDEWQLVDNGGGYYRIVNRLSGKVVEVVGSSTADGAAVDQRTWNGGTNQQFQLVKLTTSTQLSTDAGTAENSILNKDAIMVQNPVNRNAVIQLYLAKSGATNLSVYDNLGRRVALLLNGELKAGVHKTNFDSGDLPAGVYLLKLTQNGKSLIKQIVKE